MDEDVEAEEARREIIKQTENMIRVNPAVKSAFYAMKDRGPSRRAATEEIARALLGCAWEASRGMPDRFPAVIKALSEGKTAESLFPDGLYSGDGDGMPRA